MLLNLHREGKSINAFTRREFFKFSSLSVAGLTLYHLGFDIPSEQNYAANLNLFFDPLPDAYNQYRIGLIKRHITCSGRYLSELWLKDYEQNKDVGYSLRSKRIFQVPSIPPHIEVKSTFLNGVFEAPFEYNLGPYYIKVTEEYAKYKLPLLGNGKLTDNQETNFNEWFIKFNKGQKQHERTYIPWLSKKSVIYGGGDNPLLRGGIAMASFAIEYMIKKKNSSLRYASYLLRYFESCEIYKTGFLCRCDNYFNNSGELDKSASIDEIMGLLLGLFYLYQASEGHLYIRKRVRILTQRIAVCLQSSAYLLVSPIRKEIHRGFMGGYVFQWAIQQAFEKITGNRYDPTPDNYQQTSQAVLDIIKDRYLDSEGKLHYRRIKYGAVKDINLLVSIMWMWGKHGHISQELAQQWDEEVISVLRDIIPKIITLNTVNLAPLANEIIELIIAQLEDTDLDIELLKDPFRRYWLTFKIQDLAIYFWDTGSWFNHAMAIHSLHYALDDDIIQKNHDEERAAKIAMAAQLMIKKVLCGERIPKPTGPFSYEVGTIDDDFYAAIIAKCLLNKYAPLTNTECNRLPPTFPLPEISYSSRIDSAINRRERLWDELPLGELSLIRRGIWNGQVRWHNSYIASKAKKGMDFCWEREKGDEDEIERIMRWRGGIPEEDKAYATENATGLPVNRREFTMNWAADSDVKSKAAEIDVVIESGGLDFMFPRILMSLWLNEPLEFEDYIIRPLRGITCLPFSENGEYVRAKNYTPIQDWLLLSSSMV